MYARCPSCNATFRITAAILQMSGGEVRCGMCGSVFNALDTLHDEWTGEVPSPAAGSPSRPPKPEAMPEVAPSGGGIVEPDFEFSAPESEWPGLFLSPQDAPAPPALPAAIDVLLPGADDHPGWLLDATPVEPVGSLEAETADTDTWRGFLREAGLATEPADDQPHDDRDDDASAAVHAVTAAHLAADVPGGDGIMLDEEPGDPLDTANQPCEEPAEDTLEQPALVMPALPAEPPGGDFEEPSGEDEAGQAEDGHIAEQADESPAMAAAMAAAPATDPAPASVLDWEPATAFARRAPPSRSHTGRWFVASLVAALLLAGQLLHHYRDDLAADPLWGEGVRSLYARLGMELQPNWPLAAYEIGNRKAQVENPAQAALDIVAEIAVTGDRPVGLPLLRVTLLDRWSNITGSGVFGPEDYLAERLPASSTHAPGTLIPVRLRLQDPGDRVTGYDLDICLPSRHAGLRCQKARNPFRR